MVHYIRSATRQRRGRYFMISSQTLRWFCAPAIGLVLLTSGCVPVVHVIWTVLPQSSSVADSRSDLEAVRLLVNSLGYVEVDGRLSTDLPTGEYYALPPSGRMMVRVTLDGPNRQIQIVFSEPAERELSSTGQEQANQISQRLIEQFGSARVLLVKVPKGFIQ